MDWCDGEGRKRERDTGSAEENRGQPGDVRQQEEGGENTSDTTNTSADTTEDKQTLLEHPPLVVLDQRPVSPPRSPFDTESDQWTQFLPDIEHVSLFKETDWAATPLGPLSTWSTMLRIYTCNVMADSKPAILYMGPLKVSIYNEAFILLAGKLHPRGLMGVPFGVAFKEIDDHMAPVFASAEATGRASDVNEMEMFVERNDFVEEAYFTGTFTPLRGLSGEIMGFYNVVHEITRLAINERRRTMLDRMEAPPSGNMSNLASYIIPGLESNPRDIPMALLYKVDEEIESKTGEIVLSLRGRIGIPEDHVLAESILELNSSYGLAPLLKKSKTKTSTILLDEHFDGLDWKGFGEPSNSVAILPIPGAADRLFGFLVLGTNPRRPIDEYHDQFMQDISSRAVSIFATTISAEETRNRHERLEKSLADSMKQIRYMAENASVGLAILAPDGTLRWSNTQFFAITGHDYEPNHQDVTSILDVFIDEDRIVAAHVWDRLLGGIETNISIECRLKRLYQPPSGDAEQARVTCHSSARIEDGKVESVMSIITDVSAFRWTEEYEARRATQAESAKRLQEDFIDFVSHELRNPLSATFQLAEAIVTSMPTNDASDSTSTVALTEAVKANIENAATIIMCAEHQKRIVDDVLTLSKLDYTMLQVAPRPIQLDGLVEKWMTIFKAQLLSYNIKLTISPHSSVFEQKNAWVICDESRIQQVFLNLMTNAIKFTKSEKVRELSIEYGAISSNPAESFGAGISWAPNQLENAPDLTLGPAWGLGRPVYLTFAVKDSGIGMTSEEIKRLFGRFEQANARTTIKYGGSGLGLFLSQRLAERQGGAIGVSSRPGKGSTFAFYVKSRHVEDDAPPIEPLPLPQLQPLSLTHPTLSSTSTSSEPLSILPAQLHILLVEDNIVNQTVVRRQLTKAGCIVQVANHGLEALEIIRTTDLWHENTPTEDNRLDVILMDWEMPVMDGLECSREIRQLQARGKVLRHIEIIATTANARNEQIQTALASGCDIVVSKPFLVKDLLVKIRERLLLAARRQSIP